LPGQLATGLSLTNGKSWDLEASLLFALERGGKWMLVASSAAPSRRFGETNAEAQYERTAHNATFIEQTLALISAITDSPCRRSSPRTVSRDRRQLVIEASASDASSALRRRL